ncbi:MAG: hypothetical protein N2049_00465 [Anaerolineales bacterium]|nr:hypothetical protein [Anaerolineales bacterium]MCX7607677.1 hypothetical protein [Anaerolineales bacterium]MDW8226986.1 hypothetical protein [Anaerolineales bacterium]
MSKKGKSSFSVRQETFQPDYSQTKRDLKRIGILAGTFILILVVLSFFQDQWMALFLR